MRQKFISALFSFIPLIFLTGCTSLSAFFANIPSYLNDVVVTKNISFDNTHGLTLDIYRPPTSIPLKSEVIIFFYGGSWESGNKELYRFVGSRFSSEGYIVVIPDYRKFPSVKFPDFMFDAAEAVEWATKHIKDYGAVSPDIVLVGHSAGANIATLLITDKSYLGQKGIKVKAGIGLAGAYDFTPDTKNLEAIFGPPISYPSMRPLTFVDGAEPPLFLAHGGEDKVVGKFNFDRMVSKIEKNKSCVTAKFYPDMGHVDLVSQLSWVGGENSPLFIDIIKFLDEVEKDKSCH